MNGRIEEVQRVGAWLRLRQRAVAAAALGAAIVILAAGERSSLEHRALLVSALSALCVVFGIVAGPWVGLSVAIVAGAVSIAFVFAFGDPLSVVASLATVAFWAMASMGAGFISDYYRRQVAVRQREVDERQRLAVALNEIGSTIASGLDRESLLLRIVRLAGETLGADSAAVWDYDRERWRVDHGWALDGDFVGREIQVDPEGIVGALEAARTPVAACVTGEHGLRSRELEEMGAVSALVVPLFREERMGGALVVVMRDRHRHWTRREIQFAQKVSTDVSGALQNVGLYEAQLRIATTLQEQMIHPLPRVDGLELAAVSQSADQPELVGGDFYDVLELPDGALSLLIGDVEGKGVRAAGLTERVRTMVRALWLDSSDPCEVLNKANDLLRAEGEGQQVAALLARVRLSSGILEIATAGHPPPVRCADGTCRVMVLRHGPPLGAFEWGYELVTARLDPGETLVLCTDGVIEARRAGELFGERRLIETVHRHRAESVSRIAAAVRDAAQTHAGTLDDDLQILVVRAASRGLGGKDTTTAQRTVR
jgi:GAF domain-containing protein